ncbi:dihydropteroate synthase [Noviherbaspirillum galbum]|uniref:Dihydropteroate synthase n=1 Tax=Noviherbaspirillum galbum TaxID=2709383 RepID=A0A6B3SLC1_9BURK|nr:dihydropteroate synthase [Noviherbaspirillum galbum]NEX61603.1 dihydropteroate synthase [Noviherbaspirillum galbum]
MTASTTPSTSLRCGRYRLAVGEHDRPLVMGILNVTPDSFSDGGHYQALDVAISHAEQMIADGVDIIDIGGESSRPGAQPLPLQEELRRVMPVIYALRDCGKPISIDTYKPEVMHEAIQAGVDMVNDINAFRAEGALRAVKDAEVALCIMHMLGEPKTMQAEPHYDDVQAEVADFLLERIQALRDAGIAAGRLCIDPGFGFGKTLTHNLILLQGLRRLIDATGLPLLAGMSRKSMIGAVTGKPVEERMAGSIAAAVIAAERGARILRVHDVGATVDAIAVWDAVRKQQSV